MTGTTSKPKAKAKRKVKAKSPAAGLLEALKFVSAGQKRNGDVIDTHVCIFNGMISAYNKGLSLGAPIAEQLSTCPHSYTLAAALRKCGESMTLTQLDNNSLQVTSGKLSVNVPCVSHETMAISIPDPQCGELDENVRQGFKELAWIVDENATKAYGAGIMLTDGKMIAVNGHVMLEYWHGVNLPEMKLIPKPAVTAVCKQASALTGFGFSPTTFTFYFENGSFVKTGLLSTPYPNTETLFKHDDNPIEVTSEFIEAVEAVKDFTDTTLIYFIDGQVRSHYSGKIGAIYDCDCILDNLAYNAEDLNVALKLAHKFYFPAKGNAVFYGERIRGAISQGRI